ncbi:MAG: YqzL family protein [Clostridia bacterium]|nr:YqzL family protein [Clostridia bacterium]MCI9275608.1 YqzL family protein [Clostridia bacterium]
MISKMAWNAFKKTGDINTYLEFVETKNIEENIVEEENGNNQNKGYYFKRK